ncbi:MAG: hypothetical protein AAF602_22255, partial [Myxococcota bacterium]
MTHRLRPHGAAEALAALDRLAHVPPLDVPDGLTATQEAVAQLFHWLHTEQPDALDALPSVWSGLGDAGFEALARASAVDETERIEHDVLGRYEGHRLGRHLLVRRRYPDGRTQIAVRGFPDAQAAHTWLGGQAQRIARQIPPTFANLPEDAPETDLPTWLAAAVARPPPRDFPGFVDARRAPRLVRRGTDRALSTGAVSGLLKELVRARRRGLFGRLSEEVRELLEPASGQALAVWLLDAWAADGGYAAHRWCTLPLRLWPSAENTRRLGRVVDDLRSRLNSSGVRFGIRMLDAIGDDAALALLARFAEHGSRAQSRDADAAIVQAARSRGVDRSRIEALVPLGMDDFAVDDRGVVSVRFTDTVSAEIDVTDLDRLRPRWRVGDRVLWRAPRGLKRAHPEPTDALHRLRRRMQREVRREATRLEQALFELDGRPWSSWRVYFAHRLLR